MITVSRLTVYKQVPGADIEPGWWAVVIRSSPAEGRAESTPPLSRRRPGYISGPGLRPP
jgi:hypothetical protein